MFVDWVGGFLFKQWVTETTANPFCTLALNRVAGADGHVGAEVGTEQKEGL